MNPTSANADKDGMFPPEVAANFPSMIRILVICWVSIGIVGIALIFPFKEEKKLVL